MKLLRSFALFAMCFVFHLSFAASPYAPNTVGPPGMDNAVGDYSYDFAGNRVRNAAPGNVQTITYGLVGKPVSINTRNGDIETIHYGVGARRYLRVNADQEKIFYIGDMEYRIKDGLASSVAYIKHGGYSPIAQVTTTTAGSPPTYRYYLQDHQGTTLVTVGDASPEPGRYDPWGTPVSATGKEVDRDAVDEDNRGFTGHETLKSAGLVHANGRVLDPPVGFVSADPMLEPHDLRSLNRYSYVRHNPLHATDPSGFTLVLDFSISKGFFAKSDTHEIYVQNFVDLINNAPWGDKSFILGAITDNSTELRLLNQRKKGNALSAVGRERITVDFIRLVGEAAPGGSNTAIHIIRLNRQIAKNFIGIRPATEDSAVVLGNFEELTPLRYSYARYTLAFGGTNPFAAAPLHGPHAAPEGPAVLPQAAGHARTPFTQHREDVRFKPILGGDLVPMPPPSPPPSPTQLLKEDFIHTPPPSPPLDVINHFNHFKHL